jgi:hypothetical protein
MMKNLKTGGIKMDVQKEKDKRMTGVNWLEVRSNTVLYE